MSEVETKPEPAGELPRFPSRSVWTDYNQMPVKSGTNGWAVASLVLGVCGGLVLGVIFGIRALTQINDTGQKGKGFAIAGIVLSGVWIAVFVMIAVQSSSGQPQRSADGTVTKQGSVSVLELHVGDCAQNPGTGRLIEVTVVPCDQPHTAQVVARPSFPDSGDYPGDSAAASESQTLCVTAVKATVDSSKVTETMNVVAAHPTAAAWNDGTHAATCLVTDATPFTGSVLVSSP